MDKPVADVTVSRTFPERRILDTRRASPTDLAEVDRRHRERRQFAATPVRVTAFADLPETQDDKWFAFDRADEMREAAAERDERNFGRDL